MTSKITFRIEDETRQLLDSRAGALKLSVSEYLRALVEGRISNAPCGCIPPALKRIIDADVDSGCYSDEIECMVHYIREGMKAEGRILIPAEVSQ